MAHGALQAVLEFHQAMGQTIGDPTKPNVDIDTEFRWDLIYEEFTELTEALFDSKKKDGTEYTPKERIVAVADALGDIQYVINGAAVTWGIDLGGVFDAIHTSNMTKKRSNKRADGKILKDADYRPPFIQEALDEASRQIQQVDGFGDDSWWPVPTVNQEQEPKKGLRASADAKLKALKEIDKEASFFMKGFGEEPVPDFGVNQLPPEMASSLLTESKDSFDFSDTEEPTNPHIDIGIRGQMTKYGAFVFDCPCGRTHGVPSTLGSRGGLTDKATCECMCGKAFTIEFSKTKQPIVHVTTIEELRKE